MPHQYNEDEDNMTDSAGLTSETSSDKKTPNAEKTCIITRDQLPLSCPMDDMTLWNSHPKVYLPIEKTGKAQCPYCGTKYILQDQTVS